MFKSQILDPESNVDSAYLVLEDQVQQVQVTGDNFPKPNQEPSSILILPSTRYYLQEECPIQ